MLKRLLLAPFIVIFCVAILVTACDLDNVSTVTR